MTILEKYIQFAINLGFEFKNVKIDRFQTTIDTITFFDKLGNRYNYGITDLIMSNPFLEKIALGILTNEYNEEAISLIDNNKELFNELLDELTSKQAIAIRENKLEKFIENEIGLKS